MSLQLSELRESLEGEQARLVQLLSEREREIERQAAVIERLRGTCVGQGAGSTVSLKRRPKLLRGAERPRLGLRGSSSLRQGSNTRGTRKLRGDSEGTNSGVSSIG